MADHGEIERLRRNMIKIIPRRVSGLLLQILAKAKEANITSYLIEWKVKKQTSERFMQENSSISPLKKKKNKKII